MPDYALVRERLKKTRQQRDLSLREAEEETGVGAATLSRIERGASTPDVSTLEKLIGWLELERSAVFNAAAIETDSTPDAVTALLRADPNLDSKTVQALVAIFETAYEQFTGKADRRKKCRDQARDQRAADVRELDVFEQRAEVEKKLAEIQARAERVIVYPINRDEALWLCARIRAVLDATIDGQVTYGLVSPDAEDIAASASPMFTERDAVVWALYTGRHDANA